MNLKRSDYYSNDRFGYILFSISRCFNDLSIVKTLIDRSNSIEFSDEMIKINYKLYITKMYLSHLKEAMKLLKKIYSDSELCNYFCTDEIKDNFNHINSELIYEENSVNKKFLSIRHDVFHYYNDGEQNINDFIDSNNKLIENKMEVIVNCVSGKYTGETACDVLTLTKYFKLKEIPSEVSDLFKIVYTIIQQILTYNLGKQ